MNPRALLKATASAFRDAGIPDPEVDAALLLSHVTGQPPLSLRLDMTTALPDDVLTRFDALVSRRLTRQPLQYLLHTQPFLGRDFYVDERVLIPRPETELLAERAIAALREHPHPVALDLCCGSGALAVSMALEVPGAQVHAADLSPDALAVTAKNAELLGASVTLHQGDLFAAVPEIAFDVIVSNPPYIPRNDIPGLDHSVRDYEPHLALYGGNDGLDYYRAIVKNYTPVRTGWISTAGLHRTRRISCVRAAYCCWRSASTRPKRSWRCWRILRMCRRTRTISTSPE